MFIQAVPSQPTQIFQKELSVPYKLGDLEVWLDPRIDASWSNLSRGNGNLVNLGSATVDPISVGYDNDLQLIDENQWGTATTSGITTTATNKEQTVIGIMRWNGAGNWPGITAPSWLQVGDIGLNVYPSQQEIGSTMYSSYQTPSDASLNDDVDLSAGPKMYVGFTTRYDGTRVQTSVYDPARQNYPVSSGGIFDVQNTQGVAFGIQTIDKLKSGAVLKYNRKLTLAEADSIYDWYVENYYPDLTL